MIENPVQSISSSVVGMFIRATVGELEEQSRTALSELDHAFKA